MKLNGFDQAQRAYENQLPPEGKYECKECGTTYDEDQPYCDDCELTSMLTDLEDAKSPVWEYIDGLHKQIDNKETEKLRARVEELENWLKEDLENNWGRMSDIFENDLKQLLEKDWK